MSPLIVTGFHRSATSVTAQWLYAAGVPMGQWLLWSAPSNPDGHFEDFALVSRLDAALAGQGTSWQFHDECALYPHRETPRLTRYARERSASTTGGLWATKDPRHCLFLPAWHRALGDYGRYLFLLRHWAESIQSLLRRHSEVLAVSSNGIGAASPHLRFWREPELAIRMWMAYYRRVLAFTAEHSPRCLLLTQRRLFAGIDLPAVLREGLNVPIADAASPLDHGLLVSSVDPLVKNFAPASLCAQAESLWSSLLELGAWQAEDESVHWRADCDSAPDTAFEAGRSLNGSPEYELPPTSLAEHVKWLESQRGVADIGGVAAWMEQEAPTDYKLWERVARLAMRQSDWVKAEEILQRIVREAKAPPYLFRLIGDCRAGCGDDIAAERAYRKAVAGNPRNPTFPVQLSWLQRRQGKHGAAEATLREALEQFEEPPAQVLLALVDALQQQGRTTEGIGLLLEKSRRQSVLERRLAALEMGEDREQGLERYRSWARSVIDEGVQVSILQAIDRLVPHDAAAEDLRRRLLRVWQGWDCDRVDCSAESGTSYQRVEGDGSKSEGEDG